MRWRNNVGAVQSRPIDNDPQFLTILDAINPLLARTASRSCRTRDRLRGGRGYGSQPLD